MNTVLITGANRGIGLEFARQYAADGWQVVACCRQPQQAEALNRLADQYKDRFSIHRLDVRELAEIDQLSHKLQDLSIDILINNAGVYPHAQNGEFGRISYDDWMEAFRVNTFAPLKMVEALIEQIACSQLKIVATITSKMGSIADNQRGGSYIYRSSKAAVNTVVKALPSICSHAALSRCCCIRLGANRYGWTGCTDLDKTECYRDEKYSG